MTGARRVVCAVDLCARVDENEVCAAQLRYADRHHNGLTERGSSAVSVRRRRSGATSFFVVVLWILRSRHCENLLISKPHKIHLVVRIHFSAAFWRVAVSRLARFDLVSSCARRFFKHFRRRSLWMIRNTDDCRMPVSLTIARTER